MTTRDVRGGGGAEQGILVGALEGEAAEEGGAEAGAGMGRAIVEIHGDDEDDDVDSYNGGHQPGEPFLGFGGRRRPRVARLLAPAGLDFDRSLWRRRRGDRSPSHWSYDQRMKILMGVVLIGAHGVESFLGIDVEVVFCMPVILM